MTLPSLVCTVVSSESQRGLICVCGTNCKISMVQMCKNNTIFNINITSESKMFKLVMMTCSVMTSSIVMTQFLPKSFDLVTSPDGLQLCAVDKPSAVFKVNGADVNSVCIPPSVQCAQSCTLKHNCTGFNYRQDLVLCQLYHYTPTVCGYQQWCTFFQVRPGTFSTLPLRTDRMQLSTVVCILSGKA